VNALVLYESKYGNTERVAEAIALALQQSLPTRLAAVGEIDDCEEALRGLGLLVVGGPTHRHGVSPILHETLECLGGHALEGIAVATFDTRLHGMRIVTGSAAVRLARLLRHHGARIVVAPESFLVEGAEGPLDAGELEHAREWVAEILEAVAALA